MIPILLVLFLSEPCPAGLKPGERPGPYSSIVSVGPQRGQSHCFICETATKPAIVLFAREPGKPLGELAARFDKLLLDPKNAQLRCWITFLHENQPALDPKVVAWSREHGLRGIPCGIFEDLIGPPTYRLHRDADVTVLLYVNQKIVAGFAWRPGELTKDQMDLVLAKVPALLSAMK